MRAEILVVGNELLNGTTLDTNSFWLSKELAKTGVKVERKTTVRDELSAISLAFKQCISRKPDWVFSVGGLGPTYDDMTVRGLALALGKRLKLDPAAVRMLKESYKRRARFFKRPVKRLGKASMKMAMIPQGAKPLHNPVGSAPAVSARFGPTRIVSLPGVPSEMKGIFLTEVVPLLKSSSFTNAEEWIRLQGISESQLSPTISRISRKHASLLYVKSHPKGFERGQSIIQVQIILTAPMDGRKAGLEALRDATREMEIAARKLGARVSRVKSV